MRIAILMTCHNRRDKTERCILSLVRGNVNTQIHFVVVDDGSKDGTVEMLTEMKQEYSIDVILGDGNLYYSGGMRKAMEHLLNNKKNTYDFLLLANDDVCFRDGAIEKLLIESEVKNNAVIVGVTCDEKGEYTYGAIKYDKGIKYHGVGIEQPNTPCDTFNANCVIIPWQAFINTGTMDEHYIHTLGDFDYGLELKRKGYEIYPSREYVGVCNKNKVQGTWGDVRLSRRERIRKKEQVKGSPWKPWFYFLKKNFGLWMALRGSITPYIRILLNK